MNRKPTPPDGLVIVDKPSGFTSHDVVAKMRGIAGTRRVGHAGTLDPMATGVLVLGIEKATKLLGHLALTEKEYLGTIRLGQTTLTDDAEGEITGSTDASKVTRDAIDAGIAELSGAIMQVPSKVSAIKINGVRSYKRARDGEDFEIPARPVTVSSFSVYDVRDAVAEDGTRSWTWSCPSSAPPAPTSGPSPATWAPVWVSAATSPPCAAPASAPTNWTRRGRSTSSSRS